MNWNNLKNGKCPKCNAVVGFESVKQMYTCSNMAEGCDFRIGKEKFEKIVNDLYKPKNRPSFNDNLSELNNLGREVIAEDFSDSPFLDN